MQEPPNESDTSVSTLIIVFGSYALYLFSSTLPVLFISRNTVLSELMQLLTWIRILGQNILTVQAAARGAQEKKGVKLKSICVVHEYVVFSIFVVWDREKVSEIGDKAPGRVRVQ